MIDPTQGQIDASSLALMTDREGDPDGGFPGSFRERAPLTPRRLVRSLAGHPGRTLAGAILVVIALWALVPSLFAPDSPTFAVPLDRLQSPSWAHPFGTDELGRDVLSRVIYGSSLTIKAALLVIAIALGFGGAIGSIAGSVGGWLDDVLMRIIDSMMAVPALLLALALVVALGIGTIHIAIAIGIADIGLFARVTRAEVLRIRSELYVDAAHASGMRWSAVLVRHVLPNARGPILALSMLQLGVAILAIASLSFLGYGAAPPAPEWGSLIAEGQSYLPGAWWMATFPGLVVALVVLSANRLARAFEPGRA